MGLYSYALFIIDLYVCCGSRGSSFALFRPDFEWSQTMDIYKYKPKKCSRSPVNGGFHNKRSDVFGFCWIQLSFPPASNQKRACILVVHFCKHPRYPKTASFKESCAQTGVEAFSAKVRACHDEADNTGVHLGASTCKNWLLLRNFKSATKIRNTLMYYVQAK